MAATRSVLAVSPDFSSARPASGTSRAEPATAGMTTQQPAGTPVPVEERVDALEHVVHVSEPLGKRGLCVWVAESVHGLHPVQPQVGHLCKGWRFHAAGEGAISCSRQFPGPSLGVACGCGATSHTGVMAL